MKDYRRVLRGATAGFVKFWVDLVESIGLQSQGSLSILSEASPCGVGDLGAN